ncbi:TIR domain-containing protein [uncultured Corynebacterium sp.]|uniref:TIR domain-containing protein n=1 Tax=uncultured Corynebacterium sp. TaxID=159447 RepID=UPI0026033F91|nr:TIR domain-containing protein [uncultured Corynebacterium sp.]
MLESTLARRAKHACYVSFAPEDREEAHQFMYTFDNSGEVFLSRDPNLTETDVLSLQEEAKAIEFLQETGLKDAGVTIALLGKNTWNSYWPDWEIAATLAGGRGLLAISLPSVGSGWAPAPSRLADNSAYAVTHAYPPTPIHLAKWINAAAESTAPVNNERHLLGFSFTR